MLKKNIKLSFVTRALVQSLTTTPDQKTKAKAKRTPISGGKGKAHIHDTLNCCLVRLHACYPVGMREPTITPRRHILNVL